MAQFTFSEKVESIGFINQWNNCELRLFQFVTVQKLAGHEDWIRGLDLAIDGRDNFQNV